MSLSVGVIIALIAAAFVAGWVDAVVGGGGLIQLPALLIGLPDQTPVASVSGTNKISSAAGTLVATATYLRSVTVDWRSALALVLSAYAGSTVGAQLVQYLPKAYFTPIVLVVLLGVGHYTWRRPQLGLQHRLRFSGRGHYIWLVSLGVLVGGYDGFLGPGTGTFFIIGLVGGLGFGFLEASALSKIANLTTNLAAISVLASHVLWGMGLAMAAANLTGGFLGARMAIRFGNGFVRKVFLVVVTGLAAKLGWDTVLLLR